MRNSMIFFGKKIRANEDYKKFEFDIKYNLIKNKYFNELIEYKLDYNSHYEMFRLDEKKYMKILLRKNLIDDYTFNDWSFDKFEFLNNFNDELKNHLKNKIYADTNGICKNKDNGKCRHTTITTLDNFIDIMYFIHNPPIFLRKKDIKYYPEYIKLMDELLEILTLILKKLII